MNAISETWLSLKIYTSDLRFQASSDLNVNSEGKWNLLVNLLTYTNSPVGGDNAPIRWLHAAIQTQRRRNVQLTSVHCASCIKLTSRQAEEKMQWNRRGRKRWRSCVPAVAAAGDGRVGDILIVFGVAVPTSWANAPFVCASDDFITSAFFS